MSDDRDLGGEPACWAHLLDDPGDTGPFAVVELGAFDTGGDTGGDGARWSLPHGGDLDANVVMLERGHAIGEHVNDEVDVLFVVWRGDGELVVGEESVALHPGTVAHVPRGRRREVRAGGGGLTYLTVHRRRGPMTIDVRRA